MNLKFISKLSKIKVKNMKIIDFSVILDFLEKMEKEEKGNHMG